MSLGEDVMERRRIIQMCMESPLYFTMTLKARLAFVKSQEQFYSSNGLREKLLSWVQTGHFNSSSSNELS
jgi:hypothetical protein